MSKLSNEKPFLKSPFAIQLNNGLQEPYKHANWHAVIQDGHLYIGTMAGAYNGNSFEVAHCFAAGAWASIKLISTEEA